MAQTYYTLLTTIGAARLINAELTGTLVSLAAFSVGDGAGAATTPMESQAALVREVYRAGINRIALSDSQPNTLEVECIIPETVGGWMVREIGLWDTDGNLVAVGNMAETYKPVLAEGSAKDLLIRVLITVGNADMVRLLIDPAIVLASRQYVDAEIAEHAANTDHPYATTVAPGFVELATVTEAAAMIDDIRAVTPAGMAAAAAAIAPPGSIFGLELSAVSTTAIAVAAGMAWCDGRAATLDAPLTKSLVAGWSAGDGAAGLFSGAVSASTWYHAFIMRGAAGDVDIGFSASATAADAPSGWHCRRIGAIKTDGAHTIQPFRQVGDRFEWAAPSLDMYLTGGFPGAAGTSFQVSVPPVPCEWFGIVGFNVPDGGGYGALKVLPNGVTVSPAGVYDHLTVTDDGDQAGFQTLSYLIFDQTIRVSVMQGSLNALFLRTFGWRERRI